MSPRRSKPRRSPLDAHSARLRCEREFEVFSLRGSKDDALEGALKQARDALAVYEAADGKATPQVRAHVKVAHDVCQAQLARFGGDTQSSVLATLSEVRETLTSSGPSWTWRRGWERRAGVR